jgi:formylglycine-generating enzyme required for sulfatase activity
MILAIVAVLTLSVSGQTPTPIPGDFNGDGVVDHEDLLILRAQWHKEAPTHPATPTATDTPPPTSTPTATQEPTFTETPTLPATLTSTPTPVGTLTPPPSEITINLPGLTPGARPLEMVLIPAGAYLMGSSDAWATANEQPVHNVTIEYDFYIGKYEITQAQWLAVMGSWPGTPPSELNGLEDDYPAYYISWNDCQAFIDTLNQAGQGPCRLPSEAEWEYACRGSELNPHRYDRFYYGDSDCGQYCTPCNLDSYAWWCGNNLPYGPYGTKETGQKIPNDLNLYDMHGNVWEWCMDYWHNGYDGAPDNGSPWLVPVTSNRSMRGGSWNLDAPFIRSAYRSSDTPGTRHPWIGFRLVRVVTGG